MSCLSNVCWRLLATETWLEGRRAMQGSRPLRFWVYDLDDIEDADADGEGSPAHMGQDLDGYPLSQDCCNFNGTHWHVGIHRIWFVTIYGSTFQDVMVVNNLAQGPDRTNLYMLALILQSGCI